MKQFVIIWLMALIAITLMFINDGIKTLIAERDLSLIAKVEHIYHIRNNFADLTFPMNTRVSLVEKDAKNRD